MSESYGNVTGSNCWKTAGHKRVIKKSTSGVVDGKLKPEILSIKHLKKLSHKEEQGTTGSELRGLIGELKTLKRTFKFF